MEATKAAGGFRKMEANHHMFKLTPAYLQGELRRPRHQPEDESSMAPSLPRPDPARLLELEGLPA